MMSINRKYGACPFSAGSTWECKFDSQLRSAGVRGRLSLGPHVQSGNSDLIRRSLRQSHTQSQRVDQSWVAQARPRLPSTWFWPVLATPCKERPKNRLKAREESKKQSRSEERLQSPL